MQHTRVRTQTSGGINLRFLAGPATDRVHKDREHRETIPLGALEQVSE